MRRVLDAVAGANGAYRLMYDFLYGAGLRQEECCRLRLTDVDLDRAQLIVRQGKGDKDRVVMLPKAARPALLTQIEWHGRRGTALSVSGRAAARGCRGGAARGDRQARDLPIEGDQT